MASSSMWPFRMARLPMASAPMASAPMAAAPMDAPTMAAPMSAEEECDFASFFMHVIVERACGKRAYGVLGWLGQRSSLISTLCAPR